MAIIDYSDVLSLRYAELSLPAKALIPVLATLADKNTGLLPPRHSKLNTLAKYAGISPRAAQTALTLLDATDRIILTRIPGHPARIIYQPVAQFSSKAGHAPRATPATHLVPLQLTQPSIDFRPEPPSHSPGQERQDPCSSLNSLKQTTTALSIPETVLKDMIRKHTLKIVVEILDGMKRKKKIGETIENPGAYFRQCCLNGWVPDSIGLQEKAAAAKQDAIQLEYQKGKDAQYSAMLKRIKTEQDDPAIQKRIRLLQEQFLSNLEIPPPAAHTSTQTKGPS